MVNLKEWMLPLGRDPKIRGRFTELRAEPILNTISRLSQRIEERFPGSGLSQVCHEFFALAQRSEKLVRRLALPIWPVRIFAIMTASVLIGLVAFVFYQLIKNFQFGSEGLSELLQAAESLVNEFIFIALALFFLIGLESRIKRSAALKALHQLRSISHIVDMHQLTKDPTHQLVEISNTESSPTRVLSRAELTRYLDYCSEILSLNAKISALFAQNVEDPVVLNTVNDMELLSQGLSAKIWQKIMILDLSEGAN